jgi:hypothetical protein
MITGVLTFAAFGLMTWRCKQVKPYEKADVAGFTRAMVWFELVASPNEVFEVLGPASLPEGKDIRRELDKTNRYDFFFLSCYSLYNACLVWLVSRLNTYRFNKLLKIRAFFYLGVALAVGMFVGDLIENLRLLELTTFTDVSKVSTLTLESLQYWTRVKWGAIAAVSLMLSAAYAAYFRRIPPLLLSVAYATAGISCFIGISLLDARWLVESVTTPSLTVAWIISLLHAVSVWAFGPRPSAPISIPVP